MELNQLILSEHDAMVYALELAKQAITKDEVPVGAVVLLDKKIIGWGFNQTISNSDPSAHAEMLAIRMAAKHINNYRLNNCELFVTLEPCIMCLGAIVNSRLAKVYFGLSDNKTGACGGNINLTTCESKICHHTTFSGGLLADESKKILQEFFKKRR